MNMNLPIICGRLLVLLGIIVGMNFWHWHQGLEATVAEVVRADGHPCWNSGTKGTVRIVCAVEVRYETKHRQQFIAQSAAPRETKVGHRFEGSYHPNTAWVLRSSDQLAWMILPTGLLLVGMTLCWLGSNSRARAIEDRISGSLDGQITADWVSRANNEIAHDGKGSAV